MHSDSKEDENGGGDSGNTNEEEVPAHAIAHAVVDPEEPDLFIAERVPSELLSTIPEKHYRSIIVLLLVAIVALVAVMKWFGLTGKFGQGNISTPFTTPIPTMLWLTMIPTLSLAFRPSLIPQKCLTSTPLLQLAADYVRDGY